MKLSASWRAVVLVMQSTSYPKSLSDCRRREGSMPSPCLLRGAEGSGRPRNQVAAKLRNAEEERKMKSSNR